MNVEKQTLIPTIIFSRTSKTVSGFKMHIIDCRKLCEAEAGFDQVLYCKLIKSCFVPTHFSSLCSRCLPVHLCVSCITSYLVDLLECHDVQSHLYADDSQFYDSCCEIPLASAYYRDLLGSF